MTLWILLSALLIFIFVFDEVFLDGLAFFWRLKPKPMDVSPHEKNDQPLALMVANWQEYDVLESMVAANAPLLVDPNVFFFLGVYPNDTKTCEVANRIAKRYSGVHVVVNRETGPTNKGQMLNEIIRFIMNWETQKEKKMAGFIIHDAEDLISPSSLTLYRKGLQDSDMIQIPVISLPLPLSNLIGGTYLDEFAESHSKDMLLREKLGVGVPSAGVGTCLSRSLIEHFTQRQQGLLFADHQLTEDYVLGMRAHLKGFRSQFSCFYPSHDPSKNLIATREFFPETIAASIKQKTRWVTGIGLQGWESLGWFGGFWQRYFLWRDRKALFAGFLNLNCLFLLFAMPLSPNRNWTEVKILAWLLFVNLALMSLKLLVRMRWTYFHYGVQQAFMVPIRWPLAMLINSLAGFRAVYQFYSARWLGQELRWSKTSHAFPTIESYQFLVETPVEQQQKEVSL